MTETNQLQISDVKVGDVFSQGIRFDVLYIKTNNHISRLTKGPVNPNPNNPITLIDKDTQEVLSGINKGKNYLDFYLTPGEKESVLDQLNSLQDI